MSPSLVLSGSKVEQIRRCAVAVEGVVQGVGFRPFVYRLAQRCRLAGYVRNDGRGVLIELQGQPSVIQRFRMRRLRGPPRPAPRA
jgi:hydrogenase maturation protein HypF